MKSLNLVFHSLTLVFAVILATGFTGTRAQGLCRGCVGCFLGATTADKLCDSAAKVVCGSLSDSKEVKDDVDIWIPPEAGRPGKCVCGDPQYPYWKEDVKQCVPDPKGPPKTVAIEDGKGSDSGGKSKGSGKVGGDSGSTYVVYQRATVLTVTCGILISSVMGRFL